MYHFQYWRGQLLVPACGFDTGEQGEAVNEDRSWTIPYKPQGLILASAL